ncbi:uncharacterized protein ASCRUDRAFT_76892 [Ascoidea rubescens DSM 1968]|uniref:Uncharacterized protein n=1 Tax=Ascoidea rubescens DSM 1968 TaxID=1344418 RepID=A0A1D2VEG2_9ASCO|nr:hypothetical protein ASCRUDRAFT_76892 [Ascoidea rubescens DSM 1968]ODV59972.1 hypothetical protein ASCRUDRAFT_76892 [Ascoidea rubescens DSM 1968]
MDGYSNYSTNTSIARTKTGGSAHYHQHVANESVDFENQNLENDNPSPNKSKNSLGSSLKYSESLKTKFETPGSFKSFNNKHYQSTIYSNEATVLAERNNNRPNIRDSNETTSNNTSFLTNTVDNFLYEKDHYSKLINEYITPSPSSPRNFITHDFSNQSSTPTNNKNPSSAYKINDKRNADSSSILKETSFADIDLKTSHIKAPSLVSSHLDISPCLDQYPLSALYTIDSKNDLIAYNPITTRSVKSSRPNVFDDDPLKDQFIIEESEESEQENSFAIQHRGNFDSNEYSEVYLEDKEIGTQFNTAPHKKPSKPRSLLSTSCYVKVNYIPQGRPLLSNDSPLDLSPLKNHFNHKANPFYDQPEVSNDEKTLMAIIDYEINALAESSDSRDPFDSSDGSSMNSGFSIGSNWFKTILKRFSTTRNKKEDFDRNYPWFKIIRPNFDYDESDSEDDNYQGTLFGRNNTDMLPVSIIPTRFDEIDLTKSLRQKTYDRVNQGNSVFGDADIELNDMV